MTGSPWDADDLAQETFLRAGPASSRFAGRSGEYTWLYAILLNGYRRWRRKRQWKQRLGVVWLRCGKSAFGEPADRQAGVREWRESLWRHVAELPPRHSDVLLLRYAEGLSIDEVAAVLACPVGTVKSRAHHALAALRQRLGGSGEQWLADLESHDEWERSICDLKPNASE